MAHVVVLGAGLGGAIMAYELKDQLRPEDRVIVVTKDPKYHFVPSNPWIAVGWRDRDAITVNVAPTMARKGIGFFPVAAERLHPDANRIALVDGQSVAYDYLVIATGPQRQLVVVGQMAHLAKAGFEKYFIRKLRKATSEPFYESLALKVLGIDKLKQTTKG